MRIKRISLKDYVPFRDSDISEITVDFTSPVQIILGSNGAGKSSYCKMMSPYPPVRSLFGKKGYKSLTIEKDGIEYKLETDFTKPSSPHFFFADGSDDNLNVGGTTDIQRDLISETLGITPLIDDLIMNRYTFPKWTAAKRKEFIMAVNPDQIGFVLGLLKQTTSKIRSCKNNLSRLYPRKILLEQEFLSLEALEDILSEKRDIENELNIFQQYIMDIEVGLRTISTSDSSTSVNFTYILNSVKDITKTIRNCRYRLGALSHIERDDNRRSLLRDKLIGQYAAAEQKILSIEQEIETITHDLNEMETKYRDLAPPEDSNNVDSTIHRLELERDKFSTSPPDFELTQDELNTRYLEWETLRDRLFLFEGCDVPLYSRKKRSHREKILESLSYRKSSLEMTLSDLETRYETLSKRHNLSPKDIPDNPCSKDKCPLYSHFMGEYQTTQDQRQNILVSIKRLKHKQRRIDILINGLSDYFRRSNQYQDQIQWLVSYAQSNPVLHQILRQMDILIVLKNNPNRIISNLKDAYDHIERWLKLKSILADLDTAYSLKKRLVSSEDSEIVNLVVGIEKSKKALYKLRTALESISVDKHRLNMALDDITTYESIKQTIFTIKDQYLSIVNTLSDHHEKSSLTFLKSKIDTIRSDRFMRLSEIERTLRSQSTLKVRYEEEVLSEIAKIEKEMKDLEQMEKALIAIPKESTIGFLNLLFDQTNKIISSVWTIPLEIELLTLEDPLNYEFYVSGDNSSIREMDDCSEGQTEILSLAINLALRIILGHTEIPLCLDEPGSSFDVTHRSNLTLLLKKLLDSRIISQLFLVSHDAFMHESLSDSETLVIRDENIVLPSQASGGYNHHATII